MDTQLKDTLQRRLHILRDELAFLPGGMQLEAKQLLRETLEENLAIARVDGNQKEIEQFAAALLLIVVLVKSHESDVPCFVTPCFYVYEVLLSRVFTRLS